MTADPAARERLAHDFSIPDMRGGNPIIRCARTGCPVVWWPDRGKPQSSCRGKE